MLATRRAALSRPESSDARAKSSSNFMLARLERLPILIGPCITSLHPVFWVAHRVAVLATEYLSGDVRGDFLVDLDVVR